MIGDIDKASWKQIFIRYLNEYIYSIHKKWISLEFNSLRLNNNCKIKS